MRPLHFAADRGFLSIVDFLATAGAEVHAEDANGMTALMYAISCDHMVSYKSTSRLILASLMARRQLQTTSGHRGVARVQAWGQD